LLQQICDVIADLPEVFDRKDLLAALQPRPHDSSLYAMLQLLERGGWIKTVEKGQGVQPTRYRRLEPPEEDEDDPASSDERDGRSS
jgi:hypothetical protein